jgi:uncharacterized protein (TIGR03118 family)
VVVIIIIILLVILFASCGWNNGGCCPVRKACLLTSNLPGYAANTDATILGSFGIDSLGGDTWVAENGGGDVTLLDTAGKTVKSVTVPLPVGSSADVSRPTGLELNRSSSDTDLVFGVTGATGPALWLVATLDGTVAAYAPTVSATDAFTVIDSSADDAVYTGVTIGYLASSTGDACNPCKLVTTYTPRVYVANFFSGKVEMYDSEFTFLSDFTDPDTTPDTPPGYAPFNVKAHGQHLYVTYALQNDTQTGPVLGLGLGFVDVFDLKGTFVSRLATGGTLNAPYGLTFVGKSTLYVGNYGDGRISTFKLTCKCEKVYGCFEDYVRRCKGACHNEPLEFDGLLGLASCGACLYFASSPASSLADGLMPYGLVGQLLSCFPPKKRSCFSSFWC